MNVEVALTVKVSDDASPKVVLALATRFPDKVVTPVTPNVPATVVFPEEASTKNLGLVNPEVGLT